MLPSAHLAPLMAGRSNRLPAILVVSAAMLIFAVLCIASLRAIRIAPIVQVPVPASVLSADGTLVRATVREGLPEYALHWDGQPPSAVLVDTPRGSVLAASVFSEDSFTRNRNAVRFVEGEARIKLDAQRWTPGAPLALRAEAVPSRLWFHVTGLVTLLCAVILVLLVGVSPSAAIVLLIAAAVFAANYPGAPVRISDSSDEAAINSYAAARDNPETFARDALLSDRSHFDWYAPPYIALIRAFGMLGFHYATANAFLGALIVILLLFGLQRLFTTVSGSRTFGIAAAFALGFMFDQRMPAGEEWMLVSALPRAVFTALLPWVLWLAIRCVPSSRRWWIATLAAGLLTHVYPLSAPVLLGALLVALFLGSDEPLKARVEGALLATAAALLAMAPYILIYTARYASATGADPGVVARARELTLLGYAHLDPMLVVQQLVQHRVETLRILLDLFALALLVVHGFDRSTRVFLGLAVGFTIVTFGLPIVDGAIAAEAGRRPYQIEMVRAIRYFDLFIVGALAIAVRHWRGAKRGRQIVAIAIVFATLGFGTGWFMTGRVILGRARLNWRLLHNQPDVASAAAQEAVRAMQALRGPDDRVFGPVGLRQFGIPLTWVSKDVLLLGYGDPEVLIEAAKAHELTERLIQQPITMAALATLSGALDAQLFLLPRAQLDESVARSEHLLYENAAHAIVRVVRKGGVEPP